MDVYNPVGISNRTAKNAISATQVCDALKKVHRQNVLHDSRVVMIGEARTSELDNDLGVGDVSSAKELK